MPGLAERHRNPAHSANSWPPYGQRTRRVCATPTEGIVLEHMELNGTRNFAASPQAVWAALHDSAALQNAIPGAEEVSWQGDSAISARVKLGLGPIIGTFGLMAQVVEQSAPSHLKFAINRQGANNRIQGNLTVDLAPDGAGTVLTYAGSAQLEGPIAMADNPLTRPLVQGAINQFFDNLAKQVH